ncbi:MAG: hypothetical protein JOY61_04860, partial [Chloroflexi bacterium]|nr:hypothetical protein [Chloroflexota bacterium]
GIGTRTGDPERSFSGMLKFLADRGGYEIRRDVLEATYAGADRDDGYRPQPYVGLDTRKPLTDIAEAAAGCLEWYADALPQDARLWILGYSLGGVAALDGATLALVRDRQRWTGRLGGVIALSAPVKGSNAGSLVNWAWLVTGEPDALGQAGRDLSARWGDAEEQTRVQRRAAFLRAAGARVLTLADPDDAVVRPEEAILPAPGESIEDLLVRVTMVRPGSMGHGAILDEPTVWRRVLSAVGPQRILHEGPEIDPIESELTALKQRLRREGRIK